MRALSPAIAFAIAVLIVPSALLAQSAPQAPLAPPPAVAPLPPRAPHAPHVHTNRPPHGRHYPYGSGTTIVGPLTPYDATPAPVPHVKPNAKHTPKPANAPEVFSEHSSSG